MFTIHTKTGTYKVAVRTLYKETITSERKLRSAIQKSIDAYAQKPGWESYAAKFQELLDADDLSRIGAEWGLFSKKVKINT